MAKAERTGVEQIAEDIVRFDAGVTFGDLEGELGNYMLPVEPLSRQQPLREFLRQGGIGYYSLVEGTLGSKLTRVAWQRGSDRFEYGLDLITMLNAGYPLHRIGESVPSPFTRVEFGQLVEMTVLLRPREEPIVALLEGDLTSWPTVSLATNVIYLDDRSAPLVDLDHGAFVVTYHPDLVGEGKIIEGFWERRFIEDGVPRGETILRLLTVKGNLARISELAVRDQSRFLIVLATMKGYLVELVLPDEKLADFADNVSGLNMVYDVGGSLAAAAAQGSG